MSAILTIGVSLVGFALSSVASAAIETITKEKIHKIIKSTRGKDEEEPTDVLPSKMENKYPIIQGMAIPWMTRSAVADAYKISNIPVKVMIDGKIGYVQIGLRSLDDIPILESTGPLLKVKLPHLSFLEIEDVTDLDINVPLETMIYFDSPIQNILLDDLSRTSRHIEVPLEFTSPVNKIEPAFASSAKYLDQKPPKTAEEYILKPSVETKINLPFYEYL